MLNPNAQLWVDALRSGEYQQGQQVLCSIGSSGQERFCCLGVACEVMKKHGGDIRIERTADWEENWEEKSYDGNHIYAPDSLMNWLKLKNSAGNYVRDGGAKSSLAFDNDNYKLTFPEIANVIEQYADQLFHKEEEV